MGDSIANENKSQNYECQNGLVSDTAASGKERAGSAGNKLNDGIKKKLIKRLKT